MLYIVYLSTLLKDYRASESGANNREKRSVGKSSVDKHELCITCRTIFRKPDIIVGPRKKPRIESVFYDVL